MIQSGRAAVGGADAAAAEYIRRLKMLLFTRRLICRAIKGKAANLTVAVGLGLRFKLPKQAHPEYLRTIL